MMRNDRDADIDAVEYSVLKTFYDLNRPLWKKRVHEFITEHQYDMPIDGSVSHKSVGQRIDRLKYEGYLEQTIANPDDTNREQLIAYTITDEGEYAMASHRNILLRQVLMNHLFHQNQHSELPKTAIINLMQDQYEFSDEVKKQLFEHDRDSIIAFLLIRYAQKEAVDILDHGQLGQYRDVLDNHPDIKNGLNIQ